MENAITKEHIRDIIEFDNQDLRARVSFWHGKNFSLGEHSYHSEIEIQFIIQGHGQYFIKDTNYEFNKNSVLIIHNNEVHTYVPSEDCFINKISLTFSPNMFARNSVIKSIIAHLQSFYHIILSERDGIKAAMILEDIAEDYRTKEEFWRESVKLHIESFLFLVFRASSTSFIKSLNKNPVVQEVIDYVELNFSKTPSLNDVAEHVYLSPCHLSKVFKKYVGIGYKTFLISRQIVEAKRLLEETDYKISVIAYEVGFNELCTFNRDFRAVVGISPSEYRKLRIQIDK
jgi:AraC-like DNA-binding protein